MAHRRQPGRKPKSIVHYIMEVSGDEFWYTFGLNTFGFSAESYQEMTAFTFSGKLLSPVLVGFNTMNLHLTQFEHAIQPYTKDYMPHENPLGVGSLTKRGEVIDANVAVPRHSLEILNQILSAEKTTYALLTASPFRYRRTVVTSLTISTTYPE